MSHDDKIISFKRYGTGKAKCKPDPRYPMGQHIPAPRGTTRSCFVPLPYPAPECGWFEVECVTCGLVLVVTAAGRVDDPVSVELPCIITPRESA